MFILRFVGFSFFFECLIYQICISKVVVSLVATISLHDHCYDTVAYDLDEKTLLEVHE